MNAKRPMTDIIYFCTNKMLGRGRVWRAQLDERGHAIATHEQQWAGMWMGAFEPLDPPKDLGVAVRRRVPGTEVERWCVGEYASAGDGLWEGRG